MERAVNEASLAHSKMRTHVVQQQSSLPLPDDVRTSVAEMMTQDSSDYVKTFEQLAETITASRPHAVAERTPQKARRNP
uniref:DUF3562 domain-containing protein n=1 Tax=Angiostrongylus cantonensis TaxID=6313 RepID=A0A0K0DLB4_ANGCA